MNKEQIKSFITSIETVLNQIGVNNITIGSIETREDMVINKNVTVFIGIVGDYRGNVSYCFSLEAAKKMASCMMMGTIIDSLDDMALSALAELSNMFAGNAVSLLVNDNLNLDITQPSVVSGDNIFFILSLCKTVTVLVNTSIGTIEMNIGLEI